MLNQSSIDRLSDPQRKGYLRDNIWPLSGKEFSDVSRLGYKTHKGVSLALIAPTRDPLSSKILRQQAPAELRDPVALAETHFTDAETICSKAKERWELALNAKAEFSADLSGAVLTDAGVRRAIVLDGAIERCEKDFRDAESCQQQARIECLQAAQRLENWARAEGLRRAEETRQAAVAARNPPPAPLSERLSKLKRKVTGK